LKIGFYSWVNIGKKRRIIYLKSTHKFNNNIILKIKIRKKIDFAGKKGLLIYSL